MSICTDELKRAKQDVIAPTVDGGLGRFTHLLTNKHTKLVQKRAGKLGFNSLYQGRYENRTWYHGFSTGADVEGMGIP